MKFFLDTANIDEINDAAESGLLDGITTNPSHVAKAGKPFIQLIKDICAVVPARFRRKSPLRRSMKC
jgi:transaldolase